MKEILIQVINHRDGRKSDPFLADPDQLRHWLEEAIASEDSHLCDQDYLNFIGQPGDDGQLEIGSMPLVTAKGWLTAYNTFMADEPLPELDTTQQLNEANA